jgi:DNA-binding SARP family transcriptional activator
VSVRLDVRILGPLEVRRNGAALKLGGVSARTLFAILALRHGQFVSTESLIDGLWGDAPPRAARSTVHVYVSRFRRLLKDDGPAAPTIESRSGGYALQLRPEQLDASRFDRLTEEGSAALGRGDARAALRSLEQALALWRGTPLSDVEVPDFLAAEIRTLEERRLRALESRLEAALELGRHLESMAHLEAAVHEYPLNERLHALHMVALYRAGRQAEALDVVGRLRRTLSQELGIEPGASIAQLERLILERDPSLDLAAGRESHAARESRKIVVALAARITAAHSSGLPLDPEVERMLHQELADRTRDAVERHGGAVFERLGSNITAVFGVPSAHEDDASRAIRAAIELRDLVAMASIDVPALRQPGDYKVGICAGIAADEVLVEHSGEDERLLSTAVIDSALHLAQSAQAREVLVTHTVRQLARDVRAAEVEMLVLANASPPGIVYRLVETDFGEQPRLHSELVGRDEELSALHEAFRRVVEQQSCALVTVLGPAGVGKSRLVSEFLSSIGTRAVIAVGRCVSYGRDISFLPIAEALTNLASIEAEDSPETATRKLAALLGGHDDAAFLTDQIVALLGIGNATALGDELFWAIRKTLEIRAARDPVVLVIDDIHWADSTLLDLLEHIATWAKDAPILIICTARPELAEIRTRWGGGNLRAMNVTLESLSRSEATRLIQNLLAGSELSRSTTERILKVVEGNPLFLEELLGTLIDDGLLEWDVDRWMPAVDLSDIPIPITVHALLGARLDRLPASERGIVESAAVIGREFSDQDLLSIRDQDDVDHVRRLLDSLISRDLIVPGRLLRNSRTYRFRHILIRDVAYQSTPKAIRARLHEQFGAHIETLREDRLPEYEEIVGYHLEAASRYRTELALDRRGTETLARRAAEHLIVAGRRAFDRDDMPAACGLLRRARALLHGDDARIPELAWRLGIALFETGELRHAQVIVNEGLDVARRRGDDVFAWRLRLQANELRLWAEPESVSPEKLTDFIAKAIDSLDRLRDLSGVARAHRLMGDVLAEHGRYEEAAEAFQRGHEAAFLAGDEREAAERPTLGLIHGPLPVARCIEIVQSTIERMQRKNPESVAQLGHLYGLQGDVSAARELFAQSLARLEEVGSEWRIASIRAQHGWLLVMAGNAEEAETVLRPAADALRRMGERGLMSTVLACLSRAFADQGKHHEAMAATNLSEEASSPNDVASISLWRCARARVLADGGDLEEAERLARAGVACANGSDLLNLRGETHLDLAKVLDAAGRTTEATKEIEVALQLFERRGNTLSAKRVTAELRRRSTVNSVA